MRRSIASSAIFLWPSVVGGFTLRSWKLVFGRYHNRPKPAGIGHVPHQRASRPLLSVYCRFSHASALAAISRRIVSELR